MAEPATSTTRMTAPSFTTRGTIHVRLGEKVNLQTLQTIIERITHLTGCTACGLLGVDLTLGGDPAEFKQIGQIPGVQSVSFGG